MRLSLTGVFADVGAMWRSERALLVPLACVFIFLPQLALQFFIPKLDLRAVAEDQAMQAMTGWFVQHLHWMMLAICVELMGGGAMLALLLARDRPDVGAAIARALRCLPLLFFAWLASMLLIMAGTFLLILPGLYMLGRTAMIPAVLMAEPERGIAGIGEAMGRTRNGAWTLSLAFALLWLLGMFGAAIVGGMFDALGPAGMILGDAFAALLGSMIFVAQTMVQAAAYRALPAKQGI